LTSRQTVAELERLTPLLARRYAESLRDVEQPQGADELDRVVKGDGRSSGVRITIVRADGRVLADSHSDPTAMENHRGRPEIEAALLGQAASSSRRSTSTGVHMMYYALPLNIEGRPAAVIRAALPVAIVTAEPAQVARLVGLAAITSLLATFVLIYLVSRRFSRSIARLAHGAARFAVGDLSHRIERPATTELATLAHALNHMAEQLKDQIDLLRAQRSEQQAIHQSMSNGMIALDLNQRVISVNRAAERLLGLNGATARGRLLAELLREPELNKFVDEAVSGTTFRAQKASEFTLRTRAGTTVEASSEPLRDAHDQPVGVLVFINDLTQLRRLESIRSDFAANVSHELRTPITNIKGYVETMIDVGVTDQKQTRKFLEIINRNTQRLASIIEDLLALARLEQPDTKSTLERAPIPLQRIVSAAINQFEEERKAKSMRIVTQVPRDFQVTANAQLLEQALGNLLSNAIRYSPSNTTVTVSAQADDSREVMIAVADQGPGIPAEHVSRIFERFYRVDKARSREIGGTGLGLSIVKHIALVHGGRVEVESKVGKGSVFRIVLPRD
jgi:two-component system phosphate regulon sensor histidine kinase PhoR